MNECGEMKTVMSILDLYHFATQNNRKHGSTSSGLMTKEQYFRALHVLASILSIVHERNFDDILNSEEFDLVELLKVAGVAGIKGVASHEEAVKAEKKRLKKLEAEEKRKKAEEKNRIKAEKEQMEAEKKLIKDEKKRIKAEKEQMEAEKKRIKAEEWKRIKAEEWKQIKDEEEKRIKAEKERMEELAEEWKRMEDEEKKRIKAEKERMEELAAKIDWDEMGIFANKRLEQVSIPLSAAPVSHTTASVSPTIPGPYSQLKTNAEHASSVRLDAARLDNLKRKASERLANTSLANTESKSTPIGSKESSQITLSITNTTANTATAMNQATSSSSSSNKKRRVGWTIAEEKLLQKSTIENNAKNWDRIAEAVPGRSGKLCRQRWYNHLDPSINKSNWTEEEDKIIIREHGEMGNKWAEIAKCLNGRTNNAIKNRYNTTLKRLIKESQVTGNPVDVKSIRHRYY